MATHSAASIYEFAVKIRFSNSPACLPLLQNGKGNDVELSRYKGKVLLIVNVASECRMTNSNYTELNQLYHRYKNKVFGEEEPETNDEISEFVCTRFKSEVPIFDKIEVNGDNTAPLYKFQKLGQWGILGDDIQLNFAKFLVDKDGQAVHRYYPTTSPLTIMHDIKILLGLNEQKGSFRQLKIVLQNIWFL